MKNKNFEIIPGKGPILLSAPHAAAIRKTVNGKTYTRAAEQKADTVVSELCDKNGTWGIYTVAEKRLEGWQDGVYSEYKKTIKEIIKKHNISLVLDIHGAKKIRPFYIDYDFILPDKHEHDGFVEALFEEVFSEFFPSDQLSSGFYRKINGSGKKTLTYYLRKYMKMPALQLEINKSLKEDPEKFERLITMLYSFIKSYENTFTGVQQEKEILYSQKAR